MEEDSHFEEQLECGLGRDDNFQVSFRKAESMLRGRDGQPWQSLIDVPGCLRVDTDIHDDAHIFFDDTYSRAVLRLTLVNVGAYILLHGLPHAWKLVKSTNSHQNIEY